MRKETTMDASELLTVATSAMPLSEIKEDADKGQVYGVLAMALHTLEAQYESMLSEADEEGAATMRTLVETQNELIAVKAERDDLRAKVEALNAENARLHRSMEEWMSAAQKPRMPLHSHSEFEELQKKLDSANTDKGYLADAILKTLPPETCMKVFDAYHKFRGTYADALPPGAVKVAAPIQDETGVTVLTGEVTYPGAK